MSVLTVKQAAEKLGVTPATVYSLCSGRLLQHQRIGVGRGCIRVREEDLQAYLERATVQPEPPPGLPVMTTAAERASRPLKTK